MKREQILNLASMPAMGPSYPRGPYRFIDREYFIITYESDAAAIRDAVPEPLEPNKDNLVAFEWIAMPDSSGFGSYTESGCVIPCTCKGEALNYIVGMYLDDEAPIAAGREIWGFPKKYAHPKLEVAKDTLTGTLSYAGQQVAMGTMGYKHESHAYEPDVSVASIAKTQVNLKLIPGVDGKPEVAQLVAYNITDITIKGCWTGPARLHLIPHVNAPVADLPVRRIVGGKHMIADLTLPYGRVLHNYLGDK
jgi:acetoacetate decarboxylase